MTAVFVTGNAQKAAYLERQLGIEIDHQKIELDELQSTDLHVIVEHKLRQAYKIVKRPVLVEDVSLVFHALGELPGPYIKWFVDIAGLESCCKILDSFEDRSATIMCTYGYYDGKDTKFFDGTHLGTISPEPRGKNGFGFDPIFIMDDYDKTRGELEEDELEYTYATMIKPFKQVGEFLRNLPQD